VVQTGVKLRGCENSTAQESPIQLEPDRPVHRLGLEVGGQLLDLQSHLSSFFLNWGSTG
jgi:hypothetical protein